MVNRCTQITGIKDVINSERWKFTRIGTLEKPVPCRYIRICQMCRKLVVGVRRGSIIEIACQDDRITTVLNMFLQDIDL